MAEIYPLQDKETSYSTENHEKFQKLNEAAQSLAKKCERAQMPSLNHLSKADYNKVYEPSDDTFLLLDALNIDFGTNPRSEESSASQIETTTANAEDSSEDHSAGSLYNEKTNFTTLEIGAGTGVVTVFLARLLSYRTSLKPSHYITDINPDALKISLETARHNKTNNGMHIEAIQCDLASNLLSEFTGKVDALIFNPPYVPTPDDEVGGTGIEASWAGGENGRIVIDRALPQIAQLLKYPNGVAYMITVDENFPEEIADIMMEKYGIEVTPFVRRRAWNEFLTVQKMSLTRRLKF